MSPVSTSSCMAMVTAVRAAAPVRPAVKCIV